MLRCYSLCLLFFLSGLASLTCEIVWSRQLLRILGSSTIANACVFAAFMAGCGLGAYLTARHANYSEKLIGIQQPLNSSKFARQIQCYARLELICAIASFVISLLLSGPLEPALASLAGIAINSLPIFATPVRFAACFLVLLIPCLCMGASYKYVVSAFHMANKQSANTFPFLYGCNTIGAAIGCLLTAFYLIPSIGIFKTAATAALIYLALFFAAYGIAQKQQSTGGTAKLDEETAPLPRAESTKSHGYQKLLFASVFLSGFLSILLEIEWTRVFALLLGSSTYSLSIVLLNILFALGLSSLASSLITRVSRAQLLILIASCFLIAGLFLLLNSAFSNLFIWIVFNVTTHIASKLSSDPFQTAIMARAITSSAVVFPSMFCLGAILPLGSKFWDDKAQDGISAETNSRRCALLYASNAFGSVLAALMFTQSFFPALSTMSSLGLLACLICISIICTLAASVLLIVLAALCDGGPLKRCALSLFALFATMSPSMLLLHPPRWSADTMSSGLLVYPQKNSLIEDESKASMKGELKFYKEGVNSTVSVTEIRGANALMFKNDGKTEATLPLTPSLICPNSDQSTHIMLAVLPNIMHKGPVSNAVLIGAGSGLTAAVFLADAKLDHLLVAELEPAVIEGCRIFKDFNGGAFQAKNNLRLQVREDDARFVIASSTKTFDVISSQPADPWVSGASDLYTQDFWKLAKSKLNKDGVFCQWLQLYSINKSDLQMILKTFQAVFPRTFIFHSPGAGEVLLLGYRDDAPAELVEGEITNKLKSYTHGYPTIAGIQNIFDAQAMMIAAPNEVKTLSSSQPAALNTDDMPRLQYSVARQVLTASDELDNNLAFLTPAIKGTPGQESAQESARPSNKEETAQRLSNLARAFSRLYLEDGSGLRNFLKTKALTSSSEALRNSQKTSVVWQDSIIRRALIQDSETSTLGELKIADDTDRMAAADRALLNSEFTNCLNLLSDCSALTKSSRDWQLRFGFLNLALDKVPETKEMANTLAENEPFYLPGLLLATYANIQANDRERALKFLERYLSLNPWDFESQKLAAILQTGEKAAIDHAVSSILLRPKDNSAFLCILLELSKHSPQRFNEVLQKASKLSASNTELTLVDTITGNGLHPERLNKSQPFVDLVKDIQAKAEDAKSGYKILGEP